MSPPSAKSAILVTSAFSIVSAVWAMWAGNLCSSDNPGRQPRQFFQSRHIIFHSRPAVSAILITPAISSDTLGDFGTLSKVGNLGNLGNFDDLDGLGTRLLRLAVSTISAVLAVAAFSAGDFGNLGRQSLWQFWQFRTAKLAIWALTASPEISAFLVGNFCSPDNPGGQSRQSFQSRHVISDCRPAYSAISFTPAISGDNLGNLCNICILGNPSNLGSVCKVGRLSRQSRPAVSAICAVPTIPAGSLVNFFNIIMFFRTFGRQTWHYH